jgi:hypothetical protein
MPSTPTRARRTVVAALMTSFVVAGCGAVADGGAASGFEGELEAMAGVADARVEQVEHDNDAWMEEIVVDMDLDATVDEVADVLDALVDHRRESGEDIDDRLTVGAGTTDTEGDDFRPDAAPQAVPGPRKADNDDIARILVASVAAFPDDFVSVTTAQVMSGSVHEVRVIAEAEGGDPRPEVDRMIDAVRDDDVLSTTREVSLTAVAGPDDDRRTIQLDAYRGLTPQLVGAWRRLAPALDLEMHRSLWIDPSTIDLEVRVGDGVTPRELTTAAYGDLLWPMLHGALDTLATMPASAVLTVANLYDDQYGGTPSDRFLRVGPDQRPGRDRLGRTWNAEAAAYLE